jgi:ABC-type phosphate transport system auxiliary subunit
MTDLLDRISALLGDSTGDLDTIEHTLTDGYACALALEAERWRLERRMRGLSKGLENGDTAEKVHELSSLTKRLDGNQDDLTVLRRRLAELRRRADDVRVGSPSR